AEGRKHGKDALVGHVIADEDRAASAKGWMLHQRLYSDAFAKAARLDFEHRFSRQNLDRILGPVRADARDALAHGTLQARHEAVVQRDREGLLLDDNARRIVGDTNEPRP